MQPLQWIRSFEATARHSNFTRAAQELGLTQPALSQHVKALEYRLGIQLFERGARGVVLTGAGSELYTSIAEGIGQIEAALGRFGTTNEHRLHVLSNSSFAANWLTRRLHGFLAERQNLDFRLSTALWQTDAIGVKADISFYLGQERQPGAARIPGGNLVIIGASNGDADTVIQVTGYESVFEALRKSRRPRAKTRWRTIECDSFQVALQFVQAGVGLTIAPRLLAIAGIRNGCMRDLGPCDFHPETSYWARINSSRSRTAREFQEWVSTEAASWIAG